MTEAQRKYLAAIAARKNIRLKNTDEMSVDAASAKISELELLPDANYGAISDEEKLKLKELSAHTSEELGKWTFQK